MISLKFPPLHKLLGKDIAELPEDSPKRGIAVLADHAIVVNERYLLFFNMKDYFIKQNGIDDEEIMEVLGSIMDFMHGRMFKKAFWEELTKGAIVSVEDNTLQLDGAVRKDLIYSDQSFDSSEILEMLKRSANGEPMDVSRSAIYVEPLFDILNIMKGYVKKDSVAFEYMGVNTMVRFTFESNPWMFGLVSSDPMLTSKGFLFQRMGMLYQQVKE